MAVSISPKRFAATADSRRAATLLEVTVAITLLTMLLIPAMKMVSVGSANQRRFEARDALMFHAENYLQSALGRYQQRLPLSTNVVNVDDPSLPRVRVRLSPLGGQATVPTSTPPAVEAQRVLIEAWQEDNRDRSLSGQESFVHLRTVLLREATP